MEMYSIFENLYYFYFLFEILEVIGSFILNVGRTQGHVTEP